METEHRLLVTGGRGKGAEEGQLTGTGVSSGDKNVLEADRRAGRATFSMYETQLDGSLGKGFTLC